MSHSTSSNLPAKSPMQHAQETFDLVKSHVHQLGGWRNVLSFYPEFHEALEKAPRSVKCPFTGDGKTKFRFKDRSLESVHAIHEDYPHNAFIDGIDLIAELKNVSKTQAAKDILEMMGVSKVRKLNEADRVNIVLYEKKASSFSDIGEEERLDRIKKLEAVYKYTNVATPDSLVARYLSGRGIKRILTKLPASLGLNPKMRYWHGANKPASFHPTMVAIFNDKLGRNCTIHKTHLSDDGLVKADVEKAKALLAEAGYPDGAGFPELELLYNTNEGHKAIAEAVQEMWKQNLGINVTLRNEEWKVFQENRKNGNYTVARHGWIGDYADPMTFLEMWTSGAGTNDAKYANPEYDKLINDSKFASGAERDAILKDAEALLARDLPIMPIYYYTNPALMRTTIKEAPKSSLGPVFYRNAYVEAAAE